MRQHDQAIEQFRKTLEMDPNFFPARIHLGRAYKEKGMYQQAIDELSKASEASGHYIGSISFIGYVYAITGRRKEAEKVVDQLKDWSSQRYLSPYHIAVVYAGLGEKDLAFEWLQKAYADRSLFVTFLKVEPELDNLRSDPRYTDLLRRLNLPL